MDIGTAYYFQFIPATNVRRRVTVPFNAPLTAAMLVLLIDREIDKSLYWTAQLSHAMHYSMQYCYVFCTLPSSSITTTTVQLNTTVLQNITCFLLLESRLQIRWHPCLPPVGQAQSETSISRTGGTVDTATASREGGSMEHTSYCFRSQPANFNHVKF